MPDILFEDAEPEPSKKSSEVQQFELPSFEELIAQM